MLTLGTSPVFSWIKSLPMLSSPPDPEPGFEIYALIPVFDGLGGVMDGQTLMSGLNPALLSTASFDTSDPEEEIGDIDVIFTLNGSQGVPSSTLTSAGDVVSATLIVTDTSGTTGDFEIDTVIVQEQSLSLQLQTNSDYTANVLWNGGSYELTVLKPLRLAGTYQVTEAARLAGPVPLRAPDYVGGGTVGDTMTIANTLVASDADNSPPVASYIHQTDGVDQLGAIQASTVLTNQEEGKDVRGGAFYSDASGQSNTVYSSSVTVPVSSFMRNEVQASGAFLTHNSSIGPDTQRLLIFCQFTPVSTDRQALISFDGNSNYIGQRDNPGLRFNLERNVGGTLILTVPGVLNQRIAVLYSAAHSNGQIVGRTAYLRAGETTWTEGPTTIVTGTGLVLDTSAFRVFMRSDSTSNWPFLGTLNRLAIWDSPINPQTPGAIPDIQSSSVREKFVAPGGDELINPATSEAYLGLPSIDLYGPAAAYNARVANGTVGTFDNLNGSIQDV